MFPPACPHGEIQTLYPEVFWVQGSIKVGPGMSLNRNMVILRAGRSLTLINPVRLDDDGLRALDALGEVTRIIRLGDFHGRDDAFYRDRYPCLFWAQSGQTTYPESDIDVLIDEAAPGPIKDSQFFVFRHARFPEAALLLRQHGLLITTDALQYYQNWRYFSPFTKFVFRVFGFRRGMNIGGPWLKRVTPRHGSLEEDFQRLCALPFDALIAAHGQPLRHGANALVKAEVQSVFATSATA